MRLYNFRKETSERSDAANWAKHQLISETNFFFEGIEGCNQNAQKQTTHLFERAHVDIDLKGKKSKQKVLDSILNLESKEALQRKINFAAAFSLPLSYVLHNDTYGYVFILEFNSTENTEIVHSFNSYEGFGNYLALIKGWKSAKVFRENNDLPFLDRELRRFGNPWPTNIDCFCSNERGEPVAIVEYQNAKTIGVLKHSNNDYFLCKQKSIKTTTFGPRTVFHDDIRRWLSQEILRVQSDLPLFVITWSQTEPHFQLKEVQKISFPDFETENKTEQWKRIAEYKEDLHRFSSDPSEADFNIISMRKSYSLGKVKDNIIEVRHSPKLTIKKKTFPHIYWGRKAVVSGDKSSLSIIFLEWI